MKSKLLIGLLALTISSHVMAQVAQKLGVTTYAERSTVLCLFNCKSEVDKCVEAKVITECAKIFGSKNPEKECADNCDSPNKKQLCGEWVLNVAGGKFREECLKAQAGK